MSNDDSKQKKAAALADLVGRGVVLDHIDAGKFWRDVIDTGIGIAKAPSPGDLGPARMIGGAAMPPPFAPNPLTSNTAGKATKIPPYTDMQKLHMRMDVAPGEMLFTTVAVHRASDKVYVFLGHGNKALLMEDDANLFPSDTLIARLRLLEW